MTDRQLMQQALEAQIHKAGMNPVMQGECYLMHPEALQKLIEVAIREALAKQPAQRTWVGLTDEEIAEQDWHLSADRTYEQWTLQEQLVVCGVKDFARAIEAKLKEKNT